MYDKVNVNKVDIKYFIKTVQQHEAVWNRDSETYRDHKLRETAWHDIAKQTNFGDTRRAKIQWKKLRDCHRDALKRRRYNRQEGKKEHQWKYQNMMQFLIPHMHNHTPDTTYVNDFDTSIGHDSEMIEDYNSDTEKLAKISARIKQEKIKNPLDCNDDDDDPIMEYIKVQQQQEEQNKPEECNDIDGLDPIDHFFASVCQSTKRLPMAAQLRLKKKIMNLVIEEEELMLTTMDK